MIGISRRGFLFERKDARIKICAITLRDDYFRAARCLLLLRRFHFSSAPAEAVCVSIFLREARFAEVAAAAFFAQEMPQPRFLPSSRAPPPLFCA